MKYIHYAIAFAILRQFLPKLFLKKSIVWGEILVVSIFYAIAKYYTDNYIK
jgi:hypothetical protein